MKRVTFLAVAIAVLVSAVLGASTLAIEGANGPPAQVNTTLPANGTEAGTTGPDSAGPNVTLPTNVSAANSSGARLAGTVAVGGVELRNEQQYRTLGIELNRTENASEGAVVTRRIDQIADRLDTLETRRDRLVAARKAGSISEDRYRIESAAIAAEAEGIEDRIDRLAGVVESLRGDRFDGSNEERTLERLEERADALADGQSIEVEDENDDHGGGGDDGNDDTGDDDIPNGGDDVGGDDAEGNGRDDGGPDERGDTDTRGGEDSGDESEGVDTDGSSDDSNGRESSP